MNTTDPDLVASAPADRSRRRWLYTAVGGVAMVTGIGLASWRRWADHDEADAPGIDVGALWKLQFETPARAPLHMQQFAGRPLLLNFWATWCAPCIEELPLLDRFHAENSSNGWQVLGLAVDQVGAVQQFLQRMPLRFPTAMAGMAGIELSRTLGNPAGGLPFSAVFGASGKLLHRKMGRISAEDLRVWGRLR